MKKSVGKKEALRAVDKVSKTIKKNKKNKAHGEADAEKNVVAAGSPTQKKFEPQKKRGQEASAPVTGKPKGKVQPNGSAPAPEAVVAIKELDEKELAKKLKKKAKQLAQKQKKLLKKQTEVKDGEGDSPEPAVEAVKAKKASKGGKKPKNETAKSSKDEKNDKTPNKVKEPRVKHPEMEASTVFVGNLPINTKRAQLIRLFQDYGPVDKIRMRTGSGKAIFKHKQRKEAGSLNAYVVLKDPQTAKNALALNGTDFKGRHLRITPSDSKSLPEVDNKRMIFVGNLKYSATEDSLREIFSSCGDIEYVRCLRDSNEKGCKGVAYVCFKSSEAVGLALELNETILDERPIHVEHYSVQKLGAKEARDAITSAAAKKQTGASRRLNEDKKKGPSNNSPKEAAAKGEGNAKAAKKSKFSGVKVNAIAKKKNKPAKGNKALNQNQKLAKKIAPLKSTA